MFGCVFFLFRFILQITNNEFHRIPLAAAAAPDTIAANILRIVVAVYTGTRVHVDLGAYTKHARALVSVHVNK